MPRPSPSRPLPASASSAPASPAPASSMRSGRSSFVLLPRVEGALQQFEDVFLARRSIVLSACVPRLAELELDRELLAGDLVKRVAEHRRVLRVLGELHVEGSRLRELERQ